MGKKNAARSDENRMPLVSFRLPEDLYKQLNEYAKTQKNDLGQPLGAAIAARKLLVEALQRKKK